MRFTCLSLTPMFTVKRLNIRPCANTTTTSLSPTFPFSLLPQKVPEILLWEAKKRLPFSQQTKPHVQKPKPYSLFEFKALCRATVTYTLSLVTQRKTEHVFNCKAKWLCMGPVMLVRTCSSPALPLLPIETALPKLCLRVVTGKTRSLAGILGSRRQSVRGVTRTGYIC